MSATSSKTALVSQVKTIMNLPSRVPARVKEYPHMVRISIAHCIFHYDLHNEYWVSHFEAGQFSFGGRGENLADAWDKIRTHAHLSWAQDEKYKQYSPLAS